jgi:tRNA A-37 threonylcarbamoyl transferase component Bud32
VVSIILTSFLLYTYLRFLQNKGKHKTSTNQLSKCEKTNLQLAIKRLHELNVVHNDLKWDNIIFLDNEECFIIDYGFSEFKREKVTTDDENNYDLNEY